MTTRRSLAALLAFLLVLGATPAAWAASTRFDIQTSAAQTATGNGGSIPVAGIKELRVYVQCTASAGTTPTLDLYLQSSDDGGLTWYDLTADVVQKTSTTGTETAATTNKRDLFDGETSCSTALKASAKYLVFGDYVRAAWVIGGSAGQSFTIAVRAVGKT